VCACVCVRVCVCVCVCVCMSVSGLTLTRHNSRPAATATLCRASQLEAINPFQRVNTLVNYFIIIKDTCIALILV
jgi:hypothetical protein